MPIGKNIVIMGPVYMAAGHRTAEFLTKRGRNITIVDTGPEDIIGKGLTEPNPIVDAIADGMRKALKI